MKALSSISFRTKCPNYSRSGPFLPDISFSIRTETANSDKKENPVPNPGVDDFPSVLGCFVASCT